MGIGDTSAQELYNRQPASALKQAGIGDSQQSTRGTPRIIGAATQKEDFVSGAKLLPYIPSWCPWLLTDVSKESKNDILHTSTDPAKLRVWILSGACPVTQWRREKKEGKLFFWCRPQGAEGMPCVMLASDRMRVVSEPSIEVLFSVICVCLSDCPCALHNSTWYSPMSGYFCIRQDSHRT